MSHSLSGSLVFLHTITTMSNYDKQLKKVTVKIRPWCLTCPDFKDMLENTTRYGTTHDGVAVLALRQCIDPPIQHPTHHEDGTELDYWETKLPTCKLGEIKLKHDAEQNMRRLGFNVLPFTKD